jgi:mRNA interferase MazF
MNYYKNEIVLVRYPFSDFSTLKVCPAIIVNSLHPSQDYLIVPLSSKIQNLLTGEFVLKDWQTARLNVCSSVKRGIYTIQREHPPPLSRGHAFGGYTF